MFQIGELAKRCQVTADTLRFYEKNQNSQRIFHY